MPKLPAFSAPNSEAMRVIIHAMKGSDADPTNAILRAHLLIERFLNDFIRHHVEHPEHLDKAGFRFAQKLRLAQAMFSGIANSDGEADRTWELVTRLNILRNELAHLGFGEMDQGKITEFAKRLGDELMISVEQPIPEEAGATETGTRVYSELEVLLAAFCARVAMLLSADIHFKPIVNEMAREAGFPPLTK